MPFRQIVALAAFASLAHLSAADINYEVTVKKGDPSRLHIDIRFNAKAGATSLQIPHWAPGAYILRDNGGSILDFSAVDAQGKPVAFTHPDALTWTLAGTGGPVVVSYERTVRIGQDDILHYAGPDNYLYITDRKAEGCHLKINVPNPNWKIATGLDPVGNSESEFSAPTYDVLADSPVTLGAFLEESYTSHGKPHRIVLYGQAKEKVNRPILRAACQFVSDAEGNFFGEVPYKRYVWHFSVREGADGAGGLEHLNGTEIGLSSGVGWLAQSVLAHEFFHLWNVKRIRSSVLGPFDYTKLPKTGALWWLEGVTDYYASILPYRYGWWGSDRMYTMLERNIRETNSNPGRFKISPYDSSYRVDEASGGRGNSNGLYVSYYSTGWLLGLLLDIEIREKSDGKYGLDDVELSLWNECKNSKPGFPEGEIRKQCVRFGGPSLGEFYDRYVLKPGDLPIAEEFAKIGLTAKIESADVRQLENQRITSTGLVSIGFGQTVTVVDGVVLSGNAAAVTKQLNEVLSKHNVGDEIKATVSVTTAPDATPKAEERSLKVVSRNVLNVSISEDPNASAEAKKRREIWRSPRAGTKTVLPLKP